MHRGVAEPQGRVGRHREEAGGEQEGDGREGRVERVLAGEEGEGGEGEEGQVRMGFGVSRSGFFSFLAFCMGPRGVVDRTFTWNIGRLNH